MKSRPITLYSERKIPDSFFCIEFYFNRTSSVVIAFTNLKELGLRSLKEVSHGDIFIANNSRLQNLGLVSLENVGKGSIKILNNPQLCYVDTINWTQIVKSNKTHVKNCADQTGYCGE